MNKIQYLFKISFIGDENTGKTSLIIRRFEGTFSPIYKPSLGAEYVDHSFTDKDFSFIKEEDEVILNIWDLGGQEHFRNLTKEYYIKGSNGVFIVFDLANRNSFESIDQWIKAVKDKANKAEIIIIGNKDDLPQAVSDKELEELQKKYPYTFIKTSAKENHNVDKVFEMMIKRLYEAKIKKKEEK